jgi:chromosomal replication initiation ATPase DnaA
MVGPKTDKETRTKGTRPKQSGRPAVNPREMDDLEAQWVRVFERLRNNLGEKAAKTWFGEVKLGSLEEGKLRLYAPSRFVRDWVGRHYGDRVLAYFQAINPAISNIEVSFPPLMIESVASKEPELQELEDLQEFFDRVVSTQQAGLGAPEEHLQYIRAKLREAHK